jgi:hypothetical protein
MVLLVVTMQKYALKCFRMCGDMFKKLKDVCVDEACEMAFVFCAYGQVVKL